MTLPFDHTHDLDLGVSRPESELALFQEWGGRLTWDEKDVSHPFVTMVLFSATMLGWADVPDSDRCDFRRRRAVDLSSLNLNLLLPSTVFTIMFLFQLVSRITLLKDTFL